VKGTSNFCSSFGLEFTFCIFRFSLKRDDLRECACSSSKYEWLLSKAEAKYSAAMKEVRRVVKALPQNTGSSLSENEKMMYPIYPPGQFENFESEDVSNFQKMFEGMVDMKTCRVSDTYCNRASYEIPTHNDFVFS